MTDDTKKTADELLDFLCWLWATDGERFYPPDGTAESCIEHFEKEAERNPDIEVTERSRGEEHGYHAAMYWTAVERFSYLNRMGFEPKKRAEREIERSREDGLELEDIDWGWIDDA